MFLFVFISSFYVHLLAVPGEEIEKGRIIDNIICQGDSSQSYALYLPSEYTPEKKWPILYALDPGARGKVPLEHFKTAAEKYNYIVAGSNNSRNGPWEPVYRAIRAVWQDTNTRLSIDLKRIYVTGFSGGSRAASIFPLIINRAVAGIIGCGAGLASGLEPVKIKPAFYHGVVGIEDFNYQEMAILNQKFDQDKVSHRLLVFEGGHDWPPQDCCRRVIEWMEVIAMIDNIRPADDGLIKDIFERELAEAQKLEASGQILRAASDYEVLASTFKGWLDTKDIETKIEHLKQSKEYERSLKVEDKQKEKETFHNHNFRRLLAQLEKDPPSRRYLNKIFQELHLNELLNEALQKKDRNESALAVRVLFSLELESSRKGRTHLQKGNLKTAILFFEIAAKAGIKESPRLKYSLYNMACAYALSNHKRNALKNLKLAVENGFHDVAHMEQDEDLEFIRNTPEFQKLIEDLKQK